MDKHIHRETEGDSEAEQTVRDISRDREMETGRHIETEAVIERWKQADK